IQAKVDADYQLAQRLQAEEQEQFTTKQKATLFKELLEQRRKHFAAKRAKEKRKKPPTQAQQRKIICTYLKNMEGKKPKDLKNKSFDSIQKMFDRAFKRVNTFVDFRTDLVEEEVAIDAIPLATKPPTIVDWKNHKEGKKNYYQVIKADRSSKMYLVFSHMLSGKIWKLYGNWIKSFLMLFGITAALNDVNAAQSKLVLLVNFNENYSKCLRWLEEVTTARESYYC
ncbi:hypothetical protein Tco_1574880, partial [Tanacetum coccineum]